MPRDQRDGRLGEPSLPSPAWHPHCWACSPAQHAGLQLVFQFHRDGSVSAAFDCAPRWEGYPQRVHGGVVAALLDSAMTHCLFAHGHAALTGQLCVRFREPLVTGRPARVQAWIVQSDRRLHRVRAELRQTGRVAALADATFLPVPAGGRLGRTPAGPAAPENPR